MKKKIEKELINSLEHYIASIASQVLSEKELSLFDGGLNGALAIMSRNLEAKTPPRPHVVIFSNAIKDQLRNVKDEVLLDKFNLLVKFLRCGNSQLNDSSLPVAERLSRGIHLGILIEMGSLYWILWHQD
ncbi:hypothetical protein [Desulfovibrio sp. JC022]|uniref:hypothetical protein n=1 Tax=Desulfovibrio sp. JC022 TaxID=2593642 RepID=UPI0013D7D742|nr:hypothetical protein [Desulfovibrio sp. JC022]NDV22641.1 hypothetical protein [Desulfovibrio sp. JC022]